MNARKKGDPLLRLSLPRLAVKYANLKSTLQGFHHVFRRNMGRTPLPNAFTALEWSPGKLRNYTRPVMELRLAAVVEVYVRRHRTVREPPSSCLLHPLRQTNRRRPSPPRSVTAIFFLHTHATLAEKNIAKTKTAIYLHRTAVSRSIVFGTLPFRSVSSSLARTSP